MRRNPLIETGDTAAGNVWEIEAVPGGYRVVLVDPETDTRLHVSGPYEALDDAREQVARSFEDCPIEDCPRGCGPDCNCP